MAESLFPETPRKPLRLAIDDLLHPARAFRHPRDVLGDPDLTLNEKRAILTAWAADAGAAGQEREAAASHDGQPLEEVLEALRALDSAASAETVGRSTFRRRLRRRAIEAFRSRGRDGSRPRIEP